VPFPRAIYNLSALVEVNSAKKSLMIPGSHSPHGLKTLLLLLLARPNMRNIFTDARMRGLR
jgi:hypothetical protein